MTTDLTHYADLLGDIKIRIRQAQLKATLSANAEMIALYFVDVLLEELNEDRTAYLTPEFEDDSLQDSSWRYRWLRYLEVIIL